MRVSKSWLHVPDLTLTRQFGRFEECGPQRFRVGDIVEIQVSFIAVPLKKDRAGQDRCKMVMVLRSMALLDGQFVSQLAIPDQQTYKTDRLL